MSFADLKKARDSRHRTRPIQAAREEQGAHGTAQKETSPKSIQAEAGPCSSTLMPTAGSSTLATRHGHQYGLPSGLECRTSAKSGRGIYATKVLKAGSTILETKPTVTALSASQLRTICSGCGLTPSEVALSNPGQSERPLRRCGSCRMVYYCSPDCQRQDWGAHKPECAAHKRLRTVFEEVNPGIDSEDDTRWIMTEAIRALGRLCWARKEYRDANVGRDPDWWADVWAMESQTSRLSEKEIMDLAKQVQRLRHYLAMPSSTSGQPEPAEMDAFGFTSGSQLLDLISAFTINSFTLSSPSLSPLGVATSPHVALFNHSCAPNAVVVFPRGSRQMSVVAIRQIEPEEEVVTSYIDVSLPRQERQSDLKKRYGFECDCLLCQQSGPDPRWAIRHPACSRHGIASMPSDLQGNLSAFSATCNERKVDFTVDLSRLPWLLQRSSSLLSADISRGTDSGHSTALALKTRESDKTWALSTLDTILPQLLDITPLTSHPTLALLRLHALLLTPPRNPSDHAAAVQSLARAYTGAEGVYPPGHPTLAVILAEWGKLLAMEIEGEPGLNEIKQRLVEAITVLRKALTACELGFGPGGGLVGVEVEGLLRGCEGELGLIRASGQ